MAKRKNPPIDWSRFEIQKADPRSLKPHPLNHRIHGSKQKAAFKALYEAVGWTDPLIVSARTGTLLDGHLRTQFAIEQGFLEVPIIRVDLSEEQEAAILAAHDRIGFLAEISLDLLSDLKLSVPSLDLPKLGWEDFKIKEPKPSADPDAVPPAPAIAASIPGDLWILGNSRLLCGDSRSEEDQAKLLNNVKADCLVTSPPYAVGIDYGPLYKDDIESLRAMLPALASLWAKALKPGGYAVLNFNDVLTGSAIAQAEGPCEYPMALEYWPVFRSAGYVLWSRRIWAKPNAKTTSRHCINSNRAASDFEHIWTWKAPGKSFIKQTKGEFASARGWIDSGSMPNLEVGKDTHGAPMPAGIASWMISNHSREWEAVYEPFCGTGTTIIACESLNRPCLAMELEPLFCDIAVERWQRFTARKAFLEGCNKSFDQVRGERASEQ